MAKKHSQSDAGNVPMFAMCCIFFGALLAFSYSDEAKSRKSLESYSLDIAPCSTEMEAVRCAQMGIIARPDILPCNVENQDLACTKEFAAKL